MTEDIENCILSNAAHNVLKESCFEILSPYCITIKNKKITIPSNFFNLKQIENLLIREIKIMNNFDLLKYNGRKIKRIS